MATWEEMSLDALEASQELLTGKRIRSAISRAYYAAYCAITARIRDKRIAFPRNFQNPSHEQLVPIIMGLRPVSMSLRRDIVRAMRRLRRGREDADYRPKSTLARNDAVRLIKDSLFVLRKLEVFHGKAN